MKKMKLTKKNKKELKMICGVLIFFAVIFIWIVQNIGLPIKTQVEKGRIKVIDISSYNGTVNWKKVKDHNINHAMIKIGSGMNEKRAGRKDSKFDTNFRNAGYASIHRGVYYYSYAKTTSDAKKEARHCLKLLKEQGIDPTDLDLPVAFDIEEEAVFQTGRRNVTAVTTTFCDEIKKAGLSLWFIQELQHFEIILNIVRSENIRSGWHIIRKHPHQQSHFLMICGSIQAELL